MDILEAYYMIFFTDFDCFRSVNSNIYKKWQKCNFTEKYAM